MEPTLLLTRVRQVIGLASILMLIVTAPAAGQTSSEKLPRVGVLQWPPCDSKWGLAEPTGPFLKGMRELGHVPGETFILECRSANLTYDGQLKAAHDLVDIPVDIIVSESEPGAHDARAATTTIPIVSIISGDPVASGLAQSIAAPGGNVTGVSYYATELTAKRLELLMEVVPDVEKLAVLANPELSYLPFEKDAREAASRFGVEAKIYPITEEADLAPAFSEMEADGAEAVFVLPDVVLAWYSDRIGELALEHGLPSMAWGPWFTESGILMSYSTDYEALTGRLAYFVDRILRGADPAELPIEQPVTYELSVNLRTAEALRIEVPQTLLLLAATVLE